MGLRRRIRRSWGRVLQTRRERAAGRAYLKEACLHHSREAFLALAARYINLVYLDSLAVSAVADTPPRERIIRIFSRLWQHLRYAGRLSDFERMLARTLTGNAPSGKTAAASLESNAPLLRLGGLAPLHRFVYITYELEKWPLGWVALAVRLRPSRLHRPLAAARCELCDISWESLEPTERDCLEVLSASFDNHPDLRGMRALSHRFREVPKVAGIKAQWLELRSEMVEQRLLALPEDGERERILHEILEAISQESMYRPALFDRLVNSVRFSRPPRIQVS